MKMAMAREDKLRIVKEAVQTYPDFPRKGVIYRDIFGVFKNPNAARILKDLLVEHARRVRFDVVVGLDSRGFLIGPLIGLELGKPFLPIRKKGKLPGRVSRKSYALEYAEATFEIQLENFTKAGMKALIVDDLLATGGSMDAAVKLLTDCRAEVVQCLVVMELVELKGREKLAVPVYSLIKYP